MTPIKIGLTALEAEKARVAGLLDAALALAPDPWPSSIHGDRDNARWELGALVECYRREIAGRTAGHLADAAVEVKNLADAAQALHAALVALGHGAKRALQGRYTQADQEAWARAAGAGLPPEDAGDAWSSYDPVDGSLEQGTIGYGPWVERTAGLAEWAGGMAAKMGRKAPMMGRKDLDTLLRGESIQDWLLRQLAAWMKKHEWGLEGTRTQLVPLARLVHEAATSEPAAAGAFRAAQAKAKARAGKAGQRSSPVN